MPELKARFQSGEQRQIWIDSYGDILFDKDDKRIAESQSGSHFYERFGAVVVHHVTGYHCLLQKYSLRRIRESVKCYIELLHPL